ncbi:unnamed protein product, partial [marine sediment metagenome]
MGVGFTLGPVVGGRLADPKLVSWFDYGTPFCFSAVLASFNMLLMLVLFKETIIAGSCCYAAWFLLLFTMRKKKGH